MNKNIIIGFLLFLNISLLVFHHFNNQSFSLDALNTVESDIENFDYFNLLFTYVTDNYNEAKFVVYLDDRSCLMCFRNEIENLKANDLSEYSLIFFYSSSSSKFDGLEKYKIIDVSNNEVFSNLPFTNPISFTIENEQELNYLKTLNPTSRYVYENNYNYYKMIRNHLGDLSNL